MTVLQGEGMRDKVLAEYIIHMCRQTDIDTFKQRLKREGAEMSEQASSDIYSLVNGVPIVPQTVRVYLDPEAKEETMAKEETKAKEENKDLVKLFPGLALPNVNKEEIDLDDFLPQVALVREDSRERHTSRERRNDSRERHPRRRSRSRDQETVEAGQIYRGKITKALDFGMFVALEQFRRTEGLVHVSQIRANKQRLASAKDAGYVQGDKVWVKVTQIRDDGKISLSMKEVDQDSGLDINRAKPQKQSDQDRQIISSIQSQNTKDGHGSITGIFLDTSESVNLGKKQIDPDALWLKSRFQGGGIMNMIDEPNVDVDLDEIDLQEEQADIELNEKEAPFLVGQTTRSHVSLQPVQITKNPDGSLARAAMQQIQRAKDRKDIRDQKQQALKNQMRELDKVQNDPGASEASKDMVQVIRNMYKSEKPKQEFDMQAADSNQFRTSRQFKSSQAMQDQRESLPIYILRNELKEAILDNRILVVIGETGSGKTTQMPQYLVEWGLAGQGKRVACTQPRRVAATSVAKRVSEEMNVKLGQEVGYSIRFEDITSSRTLIKYMTDGMLLRECLIDPLLMAYSVIILDEAHERTIQTDVLFGLLKTALETRKDLRLIVTSATLDCDKFSLYFYDCPIFRIPGRMHKVEILYSQTAESDYLDAALVTVQQIHLQEPPGDILLFLTGQEEIDTACQILLERMKDLKDVDELIPLPVYSALPTDMQQKIFEPAPPGKRKCVIATNIAEASLTIDGIYYVVDPGFAKLKVYNSKMGMDTLMVTPISQASARQRAGRAGRTGPGKCFRLYTEEAYKNEMLPVTVPEIQRTNLASTVLILKAMGINDLINFNFMDPPPVQTLVSAMEMLYSLGALEDEGLLTKLGRLMAEFPLEPQLAKMMLTSVDFGCSDEIITIVSMLSVQNVFYRPREKQQLADQKRARFNHRDGDHLTMLNVYEIWQQHGFDIQWCYDNFIQARALKQARDVRKQLMQILDRFKLPLVSCGSLNQKDYNKIRKAICAGFFYHAAKKDPTEGYKTLSDNQQVYIHPSSALFNKGPQWIVYHELVQTNKEYMREVCTVDPKWLTEVAPNFYKQSDGKKLSKVKKQEKLEPLFNKYEDPNAWRPSKRRG